MSVLYETKCQYVYMIVRNAHMIVRNAHTIAALKDLPVYPRYGVTHAHVTIVITGGPVSYFKGPCFRTVYNDVRGVLESHHHVRFARRYRKSKNLTLAIFCSMNCEKEVWKGNEMANTVRSEEHCGSAASGLAIITLNPFLSRPDDATPFIDVKLSHYDENKTQKENNTRNYLQLIQ